MQIGPLSFLSIKLVVFVGADSEGGGDSERQGQGVR